jgi:rRNA maturation RNase YbeY
MASINFFNEDISFKLPHPRKTSTWIKLVIQKEKFSLNQVNFIFCSDEYLRAKNIEYLNHKTYTDIITFDYADTKGELEGDIFISIDRIRENADKFGRPFDEELHRVIIHGILHLLGYDDKTPQQKALIHKKEDACLSLL